MFIYLFISLYNLYNFKLVFPKWIAVDSLKDTNQNLLNQCLFVDLILYVNFSFVN